MLTYVYQKHCTKDLIVDSVYTQVPTHLLQTLLVVLELVQKHLMSFRQENHKKKGEIINNVRSICSLYHFRWTMQHLQERLVLGFITKNPINLNTDSDNNIKIVVPIRLEIAWIKMHALSPLPDI